MTQTPTPYVTHSELAQVRRELHADMREELRQLSRDIRGELREMNATAATSRQWTWTTLIAAGSMLSSLLLYWR